MPILALIIICAFKVREHSRSLLSSKIAACLKALVDWSKRMPLWWVIAARSSRSLYCS